MKKNNRKKISEIKSCFFEKINKIGQLDRLIRKKERRHKLLIPEVKEVTSLQIPWTLNK